VIHCISPTTTTAETAYDDDGNDDDDNKKYEDDYKAVRIMTVLQPMRQSNCFKQT